MTGRGRSETDANAVEAGCPVSDPKPSLASVGFAAPFFEGTHVSPVGVAAAGT
jgi:hypothetical protein